MSDWTPRYPASEFAVIVSLCRDPACPRRDIHTQRECHLTHNLTTVGAQPPQSAIEDCKELKL